MPRRAARSVLGVHRLGYAHRFTLLTDSHFLVAHAVYAHSRMLAHVHLHAYVPQ
ncbi:hypothetical protein [uncultured Slackia sp.]|uniref:hypothetical protein n=1 Tax=uncultured Slackia sp. TaxID=665903 RepID=UPI00345C5B89